jgi:tight adherence protein C
MNPTLTLMSEFAVFALVVLSVFVVARRGEAALNVRRRLRGESGPGAPTPRSSVVREEGVRNPLLSWVQAQTLTNPKEREELSRSLVDAGFESPAAPAWYVVIQFGLAIGLPIAFLASQKLLPQPAAGLQLIFVPLFLSAVALILPRAFINNRAAARRSQLESEFPDALDLMVVCVEAGLALEASFIRVGDETVESHPRISQEFQQLSQELRAGRSRAEALRSLADRSQVDTVKSFVALLIQTDALGVSIAQSLRTYSQEMRQHRMLKAEEKAMRIPVLLTVPLVACILPVIVTAVMLPAIIELIRNVVPTLSQLGAKH